MTVSDDFIEAEIKKILAILDKQCELFSVDEKPKHRETAATETEVVKEREPKHVNG